MNNARLRTMPAITAVLALAFALVAVHGCDEIAEVTPGRDAGDAQDAQPDGEELDGDDATSDAEPDSGDANEDSSDATDVSHCLLIDTTDRVNSGALAVLDLDSGELRENLTTYHSDATIKVVEGEVYVMNRLFADSLMKLDPADNYSVAWEFSLGNATNPNDLTRFRDVGFVSLYDKGKVVEVNLANPTIETFLTGREIVVPTGENDGDKADVSDLFVYEDVLYVLSEGLNKSLQCTAGARSRIYAYDANTLLPATVFENGTESVLTLRACNASVVSRDGAELVIRSIGTYQYTTTSGINDGLVEVVDLSTGTRGDLLFTEQGAGSRDIFILESGDDGAWAVLAGDDFFGIDLVELDRSNTRWAVKDELYNGYLWALSSYDGLLYVSERDIDRTGILVFDSKTGEQLVERTIKTQAAPEELVRYDRAGSCW